MPFSGNSWPVDSGRRIEWSFTDFSFSDATYNFYFADDFARTLIRKAFDAWEAVANLDFVNVSDAADNDIRIGYGDLDGNAGGVLGECTTWTIGGGVITKAEVAIDVDEDWVESGGDYVDDGSGASFLAVLIHEIGHALGLDHEDTKVSIMSTFADPDIKTLQTYDIDLIRSIYGGRFSGHGGKDSLKGTGKADVLLGNGGDDVLSGGGGADVLNGGAGRDAASYASAKSGVTASLTGPAGNTGEAKGDSYVSIADLVGSGKADTLIGSTAANRLTGNAGDDVLKGLGGDDVLAGGSGADTMTGGSGADVFLFNTRPAAGIVDVVTDFTPLDDRIVLDDDAFTAFSGAGDLAVAAFRVGSAAADGSDRIIYNRSTGDLLYDPDGKGGTKAVVFAELDAGLTFGASAFEIVA